MRMPGARVQGLKRPGPRRSVPMNAGDPGWTWSTVLEVRMQNLWKRKLTTLSHLRYLVSIGCTIAGRVVFLE